ncbi:peptidoglycan-binding protein [Lysobacter silvisoli]|uniref:Lytic enzyme n=1 Tax=Lysobacter silvisoli TaxID=2293254 RepID=A0A371JZ70_9GAMM|nr:peptidoglycan-binding protein [Lysobacter silvisoli]RDZ26924.1 lytic enzyme [Lysobacter silvisoli]
MPTENEIEMLRAARVAGITTREEMANFMAQLGHESGGFAQMEEGFRYTQGLQQIPVDYAHREGDAALETARRRALGGQPEELARLMYGGRMGNDDAGDGYLYRGRGYTQLTGEGNYRDAGRALGLDLVSNPEQAAERDTAQRIALWYWEQRVPQAQRDDVSAATEAINGGTNGLADRLDRYDAWHALLTPEFITELDAGRVQAGAGVQPAAGRPAMEDGALRRLERGPEVGELQGKLRELDVRDDSNRRVTDSDRFDASTEQAVRRFQEQNDLAVTGRADPSTLQAIDRAVERQRQQNEPATTPVRDQGEAHQAPTRSMLQLDDPLHPNHGMYAKLLATVSERDVALGRTPDQLSAQLSGGLTVDARARTGGNRVRPVQRRRQPGLYGR